MKSAKRLYYVPGLISLLGLLIALPYFYKANRPVKLGFLNLFVPAECNENHGLNNYSECYLETQLRNKKQLRITINENHKENRNKLDVIRHEALKLKYFADTLTVILINLSDSITYGEFVSIVDMCVTDEHKRYGSWDNKFVIWGEWPKKEIKVVDTLPLLLCGYISIKQPKLYPTRTLSLTWLLNLNNQFFNVKKSKK
jgi:hypothetical protein